MLPHVDLFLPAHNLDSLAQLVQVLAGSHRGTIERLPRDPRQPAARLMRNPGR